MENYYQFIVMYTFSDDECRNRFLRELYGKFSNVTELNESTYSITETSISLAKDLLLKIIKRLNLVGDNQNYLSLYYAAGMADRNDKNRDKIVGRKLL